MSHKDGLWFLVGQSLPKVWSCDQTANLLLWRRPPLAAVPQPTLYLEYFLCVLLIFKLNHIHLWCLLSISPTTACVCVCVWSLTLSLSVAVMLCSTHTKGMYFHFTGSRSMTVLLCLKCNKSFAWNVRHTKTGNVLRFKVKHEEHPLNRCRGSPNFTSGSTKVLPWTPTFKYPRETLILQQLRFGLAFIHILTLASVKQRQQNVVVNESKQTKPKQDKPPE